MPVTPPSMKWLESKKPFKPMLAERIPKATNATSRSATRTFTPSLGAGVADMARVLPVTVAFAILEPMSDRATDVELPQHCLGCKGCPARDSLFGPGPRPEERERHAQGS